MSRDKPGGINRIHQISLAIGTNLSNYKSVTDLPVPNITNYLPNLILFKVFFKGLVVRVPGYRSRGSGSIPGVTVSSEK
jgi:hypothetical protein